MDDGTVIEAPKCDVPISLREVLQHRVNGEPGTSFFYNPIVYGRLSNWVDENTDRTFRTWMDQYVVDKAGLTNVAAGWRDEDKGHVLTQLAPPFGYVEDEGGRPRPSVMPNTELNASSGIISSVLGLADYSIALDEGRVLSPALREEMWTPPVDANGTAAPYAYGWYVQEWGNERLVWHGGWWPDAYAGLLLKAPDSGLALIALSNADGLREEIGNLTKAEIEASPIAAKFLDLFLSPE